MTDIITLVILTIRENYGASVVFIYVCGVLLVPTIMAALGGSLNHSKRYVDYYDKEKKDVSLWKNYSTLADFAILNPLILTVIACTTQAMIDLPRLLAGKLACDASILDTLNQDYLNLIQHPLILPAGVLISPVLWFLYLRVSFGGATAKKDEATTNEDEATTNEDEATTNEDEATTNEDGATANENGATAKKDEGTTKEDGTTAQGAGATVKSWWAEITAFPGKILDVINAVKNQMSTARKEMAKLPMVEAWIGFGTVLTIYFLVTFAWRIGVMFWYVARVTDSGLRLDALEWSIGLGNIATVLSGVNGFFALIGAVMLVMVIHDYWFHPENIKRRVRVWFLTGVVALALCAAVMPIYRVHEHLAAVKEQKIETLLKERRSLVGERRAMKDKEIKDVTELKDWVVGETGGSLAVSWQILMLIVGAFSSRGVKIIFNKLGIEKPPSKED